jgi:hypothetical protein
VFSDDQALQPAQFEAKLWQQKVDKAVTPVQEVKLPDGFESLADNRDSCYWRFCREMAERKRLRIEDLEDAGAGFTREGDWEPFCIFPVTEGSRIVYYQGRTYSEEGDQTKKFPRKSEVPYGSNYWIHGLDELADPGCQLVIVVESILNRLSLKRRLRELEVPGIAPICVFTNLISRPQIAKLARYKHIKEFCLLYDSDSTQGALRTTIQYGAIMPLTYAAMPEGVNANGSIRKNNDANDDVDTALEAVLNRRKPSTRTIPRLEEHKPFSVLNRPRRLKGIDD